MTGSKRHYLDHNATAPLRPAARDAVVRALDSLGNPSSIHAEGRAARAIVDRARAQVARLVGARPQNVVFTAGATEAAHLALSPLIHAGGEERAVPRLYPLATEHACVLDGGRFAPDRLRPLAVDGEGRLSRCSLDAVLDAHHDDAEPAFVAVQMANSETGVLQDVGDVARRVRLRGGFTVTDVVQAAGRTPIDIATLGVDFTILSSHKIGGPQGVGALVLTSADVRPPPVHRGGGQEDGLRAGTHNVAGIAGFGAAAEAAAAEAGDATRLRSLRDSTEAAMRTICAEKGLADRLTIFGAGAARLPNTVAYSLKGTDAQTALIAYDLAGVSLSSGSACSSGKVGRSHVLDAMGVDRDVARGALRVSYGWSSVAADRDAFLSVFAAQVARQAETRLQAAE